jgi:2-polyprenyl-3-methyl-5-hydroxy-6-metoxy-1,4-benzoquinol methylase
MLRATRGFGILENFLSIQRMKLAQNSIKKHNKSGKILDIGCGAYPLFLINSEFEEKVGIDQIHNPREIKHLNLTLKNYDLTKEKALPFHKNSFDTITMLAFIEHIDPKKVDSLLKNCYRLLKKDGILFLTTPAKWSHLPLKIMAKLRLVSPDEIKEHKQTYYLKELVKKLIEAEFEYNKIEKGHFEFFLNLWICAKK